MERSYRGGICKIGVVGPESVAGGGVTIGVMPGIGRVGRVTLPFCRNVPDPSPVVGTGLNVDGGLPGIVTPESLGCVGCPARGIVLGVEMGAGSNPGKFPPPAGGGIGMPCGPPGGTGKVWSGSMAFGGVTPKTSAGCSRSLIAEFRARK